MKLPKELITVTPLSRIVALFVFAAVLAIGFGLGITYQETIDLQKQQNSLAPTIIIQPTTPTSLPSETSVKEGNETANWIEVYRKHNLKVGDLLVLAFYLDSNNNKKFIISKTVPEKGHPELTAEEIYLSSNENSIKNSQKILQSGSQGGLRKEPQISKNQGEKFFILEEYGAGDYLRVHLFNEKGEKINLDFSTIKDDELAGTSVFNKWIDNTTTLEIGLSSYGPNDHDVIFEATTGKQVGKDKLVPN